MEKCGRAASKAAAIDAAGDCAAISRGFGVVELTESCMSPCGQWTVSGGLLVVTMGGLGRVASKAAAIDAAGDCASNGRVRMTRGARRRDAHRATGRGGTAVVGSTVVRCGRVTSRAAAIDAAGDCASNGRVYMSRGARQRDAHRATGRQGDRARAARARGGAVRKTRNPSSRASPKRTHAGASPTPPPAAAARASSASAADARARQSWRSCFGRL